MKALYRFEDYSAVIPLIQNVYAPEQDRDVGWCFGFKYTSGVFEFFTFKQYSEALREHDRLIAAIEAYWCKQPAGKEGNE